MANSYPEAKLRVRMSSHDAHYAGHLVEQPNLQFVTMETRVFCGHIRMQSFLLQFMGEIFQKLLERLPRLEKQVGKLALKHTRLLPQVLMQNILVLVMCWNLQFLWQGQQVPVQLHKINKEKASLAIIFSYPRQKIDPNH